MFILEVTHTKTVIERWRIQKLHTSAGILLSTQEAELARNLNDLHPSIITWLCLEIQEDLEHMWCEYCYFNHAYNFSVIYILLNKLTSPHIIKAKLCNHRRRIKVRLRLIKELIGSLCLFYLKERSYYCKFPCSN